MINKLKNWWFAILGITVIVLDQGFDFLNPILSDLGISGRWIGIVKLIFGAYAIYKLKKQLPTQNSEKLKEILDTRVADIAGGGVKNDPPKP